MKRFFILLAWFYMVLSLALNAIAFVYFPGLDWRHFVLVASVVLGLVAFLIAMYAQALNKWFKMHTNYPREE